MKIIHVNYKWRKERHDKEDKSKAQGAVLHGRSLVRLYQTCSDGVDRSSHRHSYSNRNKTVVMTALATPTSIGTIICVRRYWVSNH